MKAMTMERSAGGMVEVSTTNFRLALRAMSVELRSDLQMNSLCKILLDTRHLSIPSHPTPVGASMLIFPFTSRRDGKEMLQ